MRNISRRGFSEQCSSAKQLGPGSGVLELQGYLLKYKPFLQGADSCRKLPASVRHPALGHIVPLAPSSVFFWDGGALYAQGLC